jgi:hypothetical protein
VSARNRDGWTPFRFVLTYWHRDVTLDPATNLPRGFGLGHAKVKENEWRAEAVELLLRRRCDLDDAEYVAVLSLCVEHGSPVLLRNVLAHKGGASLKGPAGRAVVAAARQQGNEEMVRLLVRAGAEAEDD